MNWLRPDRIARLEAALAERILLLDGAMGTMLQAAGLDERDFHPEGHPCAQCGELKGNHDLLNLSRPELILSIHRAYLAAGADLIETNTFNATRIAQADYGTEALVPELNRAGAALAATACREFEARDPRRPRFPVGILGPTNKTASISPDVSDPGHRAVDFDTLAAAYAEAATALIEGGAELIMVETIFDTLNAKAALYALEEVFERLGGRVPVMISGTITDRSGRTLSGQTPEAFWASIRHAAPFSVGFNCALGARQLRPHLEALARVADCRVSVHPNAGLPNAFGGYDETPAETAAALAEYADLGLVDIVGGCCGTTPDHIAAIAQAVAPYPPRQARKLAQAA